MHFYTILSIVFPVFSTIAIGYGFAKIKSIDLNSIIEVLLFITIPALVVSSLLKKHLILHEVAVVFFSAASVVCGIGLISLIYLKVAKKTELRGFYLPTMFMNSGNMAFPLSLLAFGNDGLAVAIIYYVSISLLVYTLGIYIAKGRDGFKEIFRLPLIYATALGILLNISGTPLPKPITVTLEMIGNATIPLMIISLGYRLASIHINSFKTAAIGGFIRIFGGFVISSTIVYLLNIQGITGKIVILSSSMPSAVINFILSQRYNLDAQLVASVVLFSTVLSVFTTPFILALILN